MLFIFVLPISGLIRLCPFSSTFSYHFFWYFIIFFFVKAVVSIAESFLCKCYYLFRNKQAGLYKGALRPNDHFIKREHLKISKHLCLICIDSIIHTAKVGLFTTSQNQDEIFLSEHAPNKAKHRNFQKSPLRACLLVPEQKLEGSFSGSLLQQMSTLKIEKS